MTREQKLLANLIVTQFVLALEGVIGAMIRVHRIPFSTNVERVALACGLKGIEVEWVDHDPADRRPLIALSGQPLTPVAELGGEVVSDSPPDPRAARRAVSRSAAVSRRSGRRAAGGGLRRVVQRGLEGPGERARRRSAEPRRPGTPARTDRGLDRSASTTSLSRHRHYLLGTEAGNRRRSRLSVSPLRRRRARSGRQSPSTASSMSASRPASIQRSTLGSPGWPRCLRPDPAPTASRCRTWRGRGRRDCCMAERRARSPRSPTVAAKPAEPAPAATATPPAPDSPGPLRRSSLSASASRPPCAGRARLSPRAAA